MLSKNFASIAVVLLDNIMPVMGGFEVLDWLKGKKILDKIPFIMITGKVLPKWKKGV